MDKEQAIDLLDNLVGMIEDNQDNDYDTAFRMAIEALKAQLYQEGTISDQPVATDTNVGNNSEIPNSSDCISRQQAIDALDCISGVEEVLKSLPSVQPETAKRIVGKSRDGMTLWYQCDMCNEPVDAQDDYCRGCGRRLIDE